jgi:DNA-binding PadR family transcriptional regulator
MVSREDASHRSTSRLQDAVRLLLLIDGAATDLDEQGSGDIPPGSVAVLRTQVALQKLDFWLRNPDYLAELLLDMYEEQGTAEYLDEARAILQSEEPEVRRYPMLRFRFGAYEPLDNALAVLSSAGLVVPRREGRPGHTRQHSYFLTERGRDVAREMVADVPELGYYVQRVQLILRLVDGRGGTELKDLQYQQEEYAETTWQSRISSIAPRVRARLSEMERMTS